MKHRSNTGALCSITAALVAFGLCPSTTYAYGFAGYCCGDPDFMDRPLQETRNSCSIGTSGSVASSYLAAVRHWNADSNLPVTASFVHIPATDCTINFDDWNSEVALVNRSTISNFNGLTTYAHVNFCFCPGGDGGNYSASDSRIANDMSYVNTDGQHVLPVTRGSTTVGGGRATFVHEMGHQLGLNEAEGFDIMGNSASPLSGDLDSHPAPFPDDIAGLRVLYGTRTLTNIFTTGQSTDSANIVIDANPSPFLVCQSGILNTNTAVVNSGSTSVTYRETVYLATEPNVPPSQATFIVDRFTATIKPRSVQRFNSSAQGPFSSSNAELQGFFVLHAIDDNNKVTENNERDNITTDGSVAVFGGC